MLFCYTTLGDATLTPVVRRLFLMPMFVMASKLVPDGSEATLFSVMMSLSNFGFDVGTYFGGMLLVIFNVHSGKREYMFLSHIDDYDDYGDNDYQTIIRTLRIASV